MQDNSKPSRWPDTDKFGQAWGETSKSLSNLALFASESRSTNTSMSTVKPGSFPTEKTRFKTVNIDLVGLLQKVSISS